MLFTYIDFNLEKLHKIYDLLIIDKIGFCSDYSLLLIFVKMSPGFFELFLLLFVVCLLSEH